MKKHGYNQSADTKYATGLICNAIKLIESGRIYLAAPLLRRAVYMLPDIDDSHQSDAAIGGEKQAVGVRK